MPRITDNGPALTCLRNIGYKLDLGVDVRGVRDAYWVISPEKERKRVKIQKRNHSASAPGQYRFGLGWRSFAQVDLLMLWVEGHPQVLVIPTEYLLRIFRTNRDNLLVNTNQQWEVKIRFTEQGARLNPVYLDESFDLTPHLHTMPPDTTIQQPHAPAR
jgi:hypothetical protein